MRMAALTFSALKTFSHARCELLIPLPLLTLCQQVSSDVDPSRVGHQIRLNMYPGTHVGSSALTSKRVSEQPALPLALPRHIGHVERPQLVFVVLGSIVPSPGLCPPSPSASVYLTSPRFILIVDTFL